MKILIVFLSILTSGSIAKLAPQHIELNNCQMLVSKNATNLKMDECNQLFKESMQLFYINLDDVGAEKNELIHSLYKKFYSLAQPAGVILNLSQLKESSLIRKKIKEIREIYSLPLMIGGDNCQGFIDKERIKIKPNEQYTNSCQIRVNAAMTKVFGCNMLFNPKVDKTISRNTDSNYDKFRVKLLKKKISIYKRYGTLLTLKHFPLTSNQYDLHRSSPNNEITKENIHKNFLPLFKELTPHQGLIMTTHIFNKSIDDKDIVTFSEKWTSLLKKEVDTSESLIITDSLDMIRIYNNDLKFGNFKFKAPIKSQEGLFAIRAILAGNHIFMTRQSLMFQQSMLSNLFVISSFNLPISSNLRKSISQSYKSIVNFKNKNKQYLDYFPLINPNDENEIINHYKKIQLLKETDCTNGAIAKTLKKLEKFK